MGDPHLQLCGHALQLRLLVLAPGKVQSELRRGCNWGRRLSRTHQDATAEECPAGQAGRRRQSVGCSAAGRARWRRRGRCLASHTEMMAAVLAWDAKKSARQTAWLARSAAQSASLAAGVTCSRSCGSQQQGQAPGHKRCKPAQAAACVGRHAGMHSCAGGPAWAAQARSTAAGTRSSHHLPAPQPLPSPGRPAGWPPAPPHRDHTLRHVHAPSEHAARKPQPLRRALHTHPARGAGGLQAGQGGPAQPSVGQQSGALAVMWAGSAPRAEKRHVAREACRQGMRQMQAFYGIPGKPTALARPTDSPRPRFGPRLMQRLPAAHTDSLRSCPASRRGPASPPCPAAASCRAAACSRSAGARAARRRPHWPAPAPPASCAPEPRT